jgi:hypothetical protein
MSSRTLKQAGRKADIVSSRKVWDCVLDDRVCSKNDTTDKGPGKTASHEM